MKNRRKIRNVPVIPLLIAGSALAQDSVIERCRDEPSDAARIACLEAALEKPAAAPDAAPEPAAAPETSAPPAAIGAEQVEARNRTGADLLSARGLPVAAYTTVPYRRLQVDLQNGQVWRQIEGDTQRIRVNLERNQTVDIEESGLGGYKLRLNEMSRTIRVERIR
jgi:pyruvate/2-oxoglutarate dehydrogenase complex dihydrolipoamide acyltransferase (E2) component